MNFILTPRNGIIFILTICLLCAILIISNLEMNNGNQISKLINHTDWSHDYSGTSMIRIKNYISTPEGLAEFFDLLDSSDGFTVVNTAVLMNHLAASGNLNNPQISRSISALNRIIGGSDSEYKADAIIALNNTSNGYLISLEEYRILEEGLNDKDIALLNEIVDSLIVALSDENDQIKCFAAQSLTYYAAYATRAEPELTVLLESEIVNVRFSAAAAIAHINPNTSLDVVPVLIDGLMNWDRGSLPIIAIKALVKIGNSNKEIVDAIVHVMVIGGHEKRDAAIHALMELHPEPDNIVPQLRGLLNSEDSEIRSAANRILLMYEGEINFDEHY